VQIYNYFRGCIFLAQNLVGRLLYVNLVVQEKRLFRKSLY
jgi:hypothetical protein